MSEKFETIEEEVKFLTLGKKAVKKLATSYVIEKNQPLECLIKEIKDSQTYKKVYTVAVKECPVPVVITGKTDINNKLGYGTLDVTPAKVGDKLRLTWVGTYTTKKGTGFKFDIQIARN